jgi:hypothetical protein
MNDDLVFMICDLFIHLIIFITHKQLKGKVGLSHVIYKIGVIYEIIFRNMYTNLSIVIRFAACNWYPKHLGSYM